ncbi:putative MFS family arabinose efflux permease [Lentzea atacamensis]|uniref:Putative MFS family arabinose efflux permease n=1 Tax=Lentzea atacamensis TaxID=531938 RepID=A0A316HY36_9PSEU|nr:MFS transporter [Lentzea atacamensis]PWK85584.1 putative MFS family arabinose efflux permease [Lentzea atacamensis]
MTKGLSSGVAVALIAGVAMGSAGTNVMPVFIDDFASRDGTAVAGLVGAAQLMATAVVTLLLAGRAARPGRAGMARFGLVLAAFGALWVGIADDPVTLLLTNLLLGAALGVVYAAATAALAAAEDSDRASVVAVAGTVVVAALMIVAVPLANEQWAGSGFFLLAACCVVAWFLVGKLPESPVAVLPEDPATAPKSPAGRPSSVLLVGTALLWTITQGTWAYASVLGREHTGVDATTVSVILAVSSVVALAGAVAGTPAARRFGRLRSMVVFVGVEAVAMAVVVITGEPVLFTVAAVVWQACQLAVLVQMVAAAAVLDPSGRLVASLSGASALGTGVGPLAVSLLLDNAGAEVLGLAFAVGMVVVSLPLLRMTTAADNRLAAEVPIAAGEASSR